MSTIKVQVARNPLATDNTNDKIFVPISPGLADKERIIGEIMNLNPGLEKETVRMAIDLHNRVILDLLRQGMRVNNGLFEAEPRCRGVASQETWNPETNSLYFQFKPAKSARDAAATLNVEVSGQRGRAIFAAYCYDLANERHGTRATAGGFFRIDGRNLKIVGREAGAGITLTGADGHVIPIEAAQIAQNDPKHLIFLIPPEADLGEYQLTIKTFYSGTTRILKKPRVLELSLTIDHKL